jgi:hypothetical protein
MDADELSLDAFWVALGQIYGAKFFKEFADEMPQIWRLQLSRCSRDELFRALNHFATQGSPYPPTLPEVWQACQHRTEHSSSHPPTADRKAIEAEIGKLLTIVRSPHARLENNLPKTEKATQDPAPLPTAPSAHHA